MAMAAEVKTEQEPSIEEILESIRQIISEDTEPEKKDAAYQMEVVKEKDEPAAVPLSLTPVADAPDAPGPELNLAAQTAPVDVPGDIGILDLTEKVEPEAPVVVPAPAPAPSPASVEEPSPPAKHQPEVVAAAPEPEPAPVPVAAAPPTPPAAEAPQEQPSPPQETEPVVLEMMDNPMTDENPTAKENDLISTQTAEAVTEELTKLLVTPPAPAGEGQGMPGKMTLEDMARELMRPMIREWIDRNLPGVVEKAVQKELEKLSRRAADQ